MKKTELAKVMAILFASGMLVACGSSSDTEQSTDTVVTVDNAPVVDAGTEQTTEPGNIVTLTATITDDGSYTVLWVQTAGTAVELTNADTATITFTAPDVEEDETLTFSVTVDDGVNAAVTDTVSVIVTADEATDSNASVWIINSDETRAAHILESDSGNGVLVNVQSVADATLNGQDFTVVTSQGIPDYAVLITEDIMAGLTERPRAVSDFVTGSPTISVGDTVQFGQDIGYASNNNCEYNAGYGYWPPGPECPGQDTREGYLPKDPTPTEEDCTTGLGKVGLWVNGSSVYNWGDGMSFNNQGDWYNLAPVAEIYDVDICGGHAAMDDYHHHFYSSCLADMVGDEADGHSPLYGYAADGYPIYGPWEAEGVLAISSWTTRDYSADSATGCADGARSCTLVDQYDVSLGTEDVSAGPGFDEVVTTLSGNQLVASNGYYHEDHYWDPELTALGGAYLDQYNAHSDDERGYHYHVTVKEVDGKLTPAFPYIVGDRFAGELQDNAIATCSKGAGGPGGPGGPSGGPGAGG